MSGKVGGGGGGGGSIAARKGNSGISDIPSGSRKIVQSLKEIVNCPEAEIYTMLKECNMDPNEAVNRLLSQDPFHEVKSKKDKKKESKDTTDSRSRAANNTYNRGARGGSDRYAGRGGGTHFSSSESGNFQGKSMNKRENGTQGYGGSTSSASGVVGCHQPSHSDFVSKENKISSVALSNGIQSSPSASGNQPAWFGASGQMSMADIVKLGRPQNKTMNPRQNVDMRPQVNNEQEVASQRVAVKDEWPSIEKPVAASTSSVSKAHAESELSADPSDLQSGGGDQQLQTQLEEIHRVENGPLGNLGVEQLQPDSVSGRNIQEDDSGISSEFDDTPYKHEMQNHPVEHEKDEDGTSPVAANLHQLSIENHDYDEESQGEDRPGVIIPDHLQVHDPECSQLSFGSFGGFGSRPLSNNIEETSDVAPLMEQSDARNSEFYGDEHLASTDNGNIVHVANPSAGNYDTSDSRREIVKQELPETAQEHQYTFAQSEPGYPYENAKQQLNNALDDSQTSAHMQNLASLSNVMQGYTNSIPNTLLAHPAQSVRELELQYSPFASAHSMLSRNTNNPSLSGQSISMSEALRGSGISTTQSAQQALSGANIPTGPALPQQLAMHPYSQPTLPLTHYPNMMGYPLMAQSYPYLPSAFQQAFAGNSSYHQSLAALLPQYKNSISGSSLPQSATPAASAYGFGNSSNVGTGNYPLNPPSAPTGTTLGYEDVLGPQYKESNHLLSLQQQQQSENSPMWLHGPGSRTMSAVPTNTYYNLQAQQGQQASGFRQAQQQASQHYGSLGYPNVYQSQAGMSLEHQHQHQQNPRDGSGLGGPQGGQPSKQNQHMWQNSY